MELFDLIAKYNKTFQSGYPMFTLSGYPEKEQIDIIKRCFKEKKDVYQLGIVDDVSGNIDI